MGLNFGFETEIDADIDTRLHVGVKNYTPVRGCDPGDPGEVTVYLIVDVGGYQGATVELSDTMISRILPELDEEIREAAEAEIEAYYTNRDIERYEESKE